ncbi:MAG TPA: hypothetical protein ENH41_03480 [Candidatus Omnitrophica bacterium]|nr:hypothetical protein [Candidatus Omnitrophota bacterium]
MESPKLDKMKEDIRQKQISVIKAAVKATLDKIAVIEKQKNEAQGLLKILKHDLFDLKDGRLDRILERQGMSEEAKNISVMAISKCDNASGTPPWYENYLIHVIHEAGDAAFEGSPKVDTKLNCSLTKTHASGSYKLEDGTLKYL